MTWWHRAAQSPTSAGKVDFTFVNKALELSGRVQPEQAILAIRAGLLDSALFSKRGATAQGALSKLKPSSLHLGISYA